MGTRGFITFAVDGESKTAYNHFDSYPECLGLVVLNWVRLADHDEAASRVRELRVVAADTPELPTADDVLRLKDYYDPDVGGRAGSPTWYQLLRGTQGSPGAILQAGVIEDASLFPANSLWAEWGYVIDFDTGTLEVHVGFQQEPHAEGRFASPEPDEDGFYPVRLAASWPISALPDDATFLTETHAKSR